MYKPLHPDFWGNRKPTGQVEIDQSSPFALELSALFLTGSDNRDIVNQRFPQSQLGNNLISRRGRTYDTSADLDGLEYSPHEGYDISGAGFTIFWKGVYRGIAIGANPGIISYRSSFATGLWELFVVGSGLRFSIHTGSLQSTDFTSARPALNEETTLVLSSDGAGNYTLFENKNRYTASNGSSVPVSGSHDLVLNALGSDSSADSEVVDGQVDFAGVAKRRWSDDECVAFIKNPYQILKPTTNYFILPADAGAPPTFQPAWAREANILL